ncbi:MAG: hypothetical protein K2R98_27140 [Gemmataceae bacterium]|nr:hypothetical protein [Gemmataceae bacterium]
MDATRARRTQDSARQRWYAIWRSVRFAHHLGGPIPGLSNPQMKKLLDR